MVGKGTLLQRQQGGAQPTATVDQGATPGKSTLVQPAQSKSGGMFSGMFGAKSTSDSQEDTLAKADNLLLISRLSDRYLKTMADGLTQTIDAIDAPDIDEDRAWLSSLLEIAVDVALVSSAEGLAAMAIESIGAHLAEHAAEKLEHNEVLKEAVKTTFEGSAKAIGKPEGKIDTSELKGEFRRLSNIQQGLYQQQCSKDLPRIASALDPFPPALARGILDAINTATDPVRLNAQMELKYTTAWLNFLARAKHGYSQQTVSKNGKVHGTDNVDPEGIDRFKSDGSFQRPAHLEGVLDVYVAHGGGGMVILDNVGKGVRNSLRRIAGVFPGLRLADLKMNMLVRNGKWGEMLTTEIVVGADGTILTSEHSENAKQMAQFALDLRVENIRQDERDDGHDK